MSLILTIGVTVWGLTQIASVPAAWSTWQSLSDVVNSSDGQLVVIACFAFLLTWAITRTARVNLPTAGATLMILIALFANSMWPFIVVICFLVSAFCLGVCALRLLGIDVERISSTMICAVGAALYGVSVGLIAHLPVNYPAVYAAMLLAPIVIQRRKLLGLVPNLRRNCRANGRVSPLDLVVVAAVVVHFVTALMPEVGSDALAMHLFVPDQLATMHRWGFNVNFYAWAVMPMTADWIFSICYMLGGETAARLVNVAFVFLLCALIYELVLIGRGSVRWAKTAVLIFLTTPLTFTESSSLFVEAVWTTFVVAGSLPIFMLAGKEKAIDDSMVVAGLLLGAALSAKAVTFTILPALAMVLAVFWRKWLCADARPTIIKGTCYFSVLGAIPYLLAFWKTGNPVFPFFNNVFMSRFWWPSALRAPYSGPFAGEVNWNIFYQVTFHTEKYIEGYAGASGFLWILLLFPAVIAAAYRKKTVALALLFVAIASIIFTFHSATYLRYVFPSLVWSTAGVAVALSHYTIASGRVLTIIAVWAAIVLNCLFFRAGTSYGVISLPALVSQAGRQDYIEAALPVRSAVEIARELNATRGPVVFFSPPLGAGLGADALYTNWYNYRIARDLTAVTSADELAALLKPSGARYMILDQNWGRPEQRAFVKDITDEIWGSGAVSLRKLKPKYLFSKELLDNTDFSNRSGWIFADQEGIRTTAGLAFSSRASARQRVPVVEGHVYKNSVKALCGPVPDQGRVQVNWYGSGDKFLGTNIQVFDCQPLETEYSMEVVAPKAAEMADVYASGQGDLPVIFREVSFRE